MVGIIGCSGLPTCSLLGFKWPNLGVLSERSALGYFRHLRAMPEFSARSVARWGTLETPVPCQGSRQEPPTGEASASAAFQNEVILHAHGTAACRTGQPRTGGKHFACAG